MKSCPRLVGSVCVTVLRRILSVLVKRLLIGRLDDEIKGIRIQEKRKKNCNVVVEDEFSSMILVKFFIILRDSKN
jgi:hypothetical protein